MQINIWAVLVSAVAGMVVGSIWFGPLFGKKYSSLMGFEHKSAEEREKMKKGMMGMYAAQFVASLLMYYVLAKFIGTPSGVHEGMKLAFWVWLGFLVPQKFGDELWGGNMPLFWLGIGASLISTLAAGAIIGAW